MKKDVLFSKLDLCLIFFKAYIQNSGLSTKNEILLYRSATSAVLKYTASIKSASKSSIINFIFRVYDRVRLHKKGVVGGVYFLDIKCNNRHKLKTFIYLNVTL
ncbi:hypothetical protein [Algibacter pectinivorans]|nr:hypothetical protein [Algibacter pectinivorans]